MKRLAFIMLSICLCLVFLVSCANKGEESTAFSITSAVYQNETAQNSKIEITYPQIDGERYADINELIENHAIEQVTSYYGGDLTDITVDVSYRVSLCDGEMLSIIFEGVGNAQYAAYPNNLFYTLNINMETGEKVTLSDIYNIDSAFVSAYRNSPYVQPDESLAEAMDEYMSIYTDSNITDMLSQSDSSYSGVYSYFTPEKVGISISTIHAIGDHAETEIDRSAIESNKR